jgi:2-oxoisovalerate dehydrogenase E1 component
MPRIIQAKTEQVRIQSKTQSNILQGEPVKKTVQQKQSTVQTDRTRSKQAQKLLQWNKEDVLADFRILVESRHASLLGRKEALSGKAKFGIFGDGKELAQIALAKVFRKGDFRAGYYRDQTWMFALGVISVKQFFAQLYADPSADRDPSTAGRQMNGHYANRFFSPDGTLKNLTEEYNSSCDISPTAGQMPRLVGLALASKYYRENPELHGYTQYSQQGREIAFGSIGNASSAEGFFWEAVNAIGVTQAPAVISIWDDEYGISVHNKYQITKGNISEVLSGFQRHPGTNNGFEIFRVRGWHYEELVETYRTAEQLTREQGIPTIVHVVEVTQPQGHSTSGSHERYKPKERLEWERDYDCLVQFRAWILSQHIATEAELDAIDNSALHTVKQQRDEAYADFQRPIKEKIQSFVQAVQPLMASSVHHIQVAQIIQELQSERNPFRKDIAVALRKICALTRFEKTMERHHVVEWKQAFDAENHDLFSSWLHWEGEGSALLIPAESPQYSASSPMQTGFEVLNTFFDHVLAHDPRVMAFGEDVGFLGDVNQGFAGLQKKYGEHRVFDTGIREATIVGQAMGLAMRGLRPIVEIQYLDYVYYAMSQLTDDIATLTYRTKGGQIAPVIVRTRGHRLEGIWHAGSPMGTLVHALRGMYVCVPRNMTQAAGMYNTLLQAQEPALVIEVLNGYRQKEQVPDNLATMCVPLGVPEILCAGTDITVITYGACCRPVLEAVHIVAEMGISCEVIDVQTLLPFDRHHHIVESLKKTNRLLVVDEDVPGGASAYILQQILEVQGGYAYLDSPPMTLTAKPHRTAYGTDGSYFTKPDVEHTMDAILTMMHEAQPQKYPLLY